MKTFYLISFFLIIFTSAGHAQLTYDFTNAGATGANGPSQAQVDNAYSGTPLAGMVTVSGGIQQWTVPTSGTYLIEAAGAEGGSTTTAGYSGGLGAKLEGIFNLQSGDIIEILVGQEGYDGPNTGSGGGGTFIVQNGTIIMAAGGGGGATSDQNGANGDTATNGTNDHPGGTISGGINGLGGQVCNGSGANHGGAGGGYLGNGATSTQNSPGDGGMGFVNGGAGGLLDFPGGFGGGGGAGSNAHGGGGGGGGYSGGAGGQQINHCTPGIARSGGGGGGSFNSGNFQVNLAGSHTGHGFVTITPLGSPAFNDAGIQSIDNPSWQNSVGCAGEYNVEVTLRNYGGNQINAVSVEWSINGTLQSPVLFTNLLDTFGGTGSVSGSISLGTINVDEPTLIKVWTTTPNGQVDTVNINDTMTLAATTVYDPQLDLGPDVASCDGESVILGSFDTNSYETYSWSTGSTFNFISTTSIGAYTLTVTQGQGLCSSIDTIEVYQGTIPTVDLGNNFSSCGPTTLNAGNPGSSYEWESGQTSQTINISVTGNYEVTVTSTDGCSASDDVTVNINPVPEVDLGEDLELCVDQGESAQISAPGNFASYLWSTGSMGNTITVGAPTTLSGPQTFTVTVTNAFVCSATDDITVDYKICEAVGVSENTFTGLQVYPNPTNGLVTVELPGTKSVQVELLDASGRLVAKVYEGPSHKGQIKTIDLSSWGSGVYYLRTTVTGDVRFQQIIVE